MFEVRAAHWSLVLTRSGAAHWSLELAEGKARGARERERN